MNLENSVHYGFDDGKTRLVRVQIPKLTAYSTFQYNNFGSEFIQPDGSTHLADSG